jgi:hypothetical protein
MCSASQAELPRPEKPGAAGKTSKPGKRSAQNYRANLGRRAIADVDVARPTNQG